MVDPDPDFSVILQALVAQRVDFIVVGGVCAVLHGAPVTTFDLDVVHSRAPENLDRLLKALQDLDAHYREHLPRRLIPTRAYLAAPGHQLLMTRAGPLDLLGTLSKDRGYDDLVPHTIIQDLGEGLQVRLLNLATLIAIKEELGRDKDRSALAVLRRTLEEQGKQSPEK